MLRLFEHLPVDPANDRRKLSIFEHIESQARSVFWFGVRPRKAASQISTPKMFL